MTQTTFNLVACFGSSLWPQCYASFTQSVTELINNFILTSYNNCVFCFHTKWLHLLVIYLNTFQSVTTIKGKMLLFVSIYFAEGMEVNLCFFLCVGPEGRGRKGYDAEL